MHYLCTDCDSYRCEHVSHEREIDKFIHKMATDGIIISNVDSDVLNAVLEVI